MKLSEELTLEEARSLLENRQAFIKEVHWLGFTLVIDAKEYTVPLIWSYKG